MQGNFLFIVALLIAESNGIRVEGWEWAIVVVLTVARMLVIAVKSVNEEFVKKGVK